MYTQPNYGSVGTLMLSLLLSVCKSNGSNSTSERIRIISIPATLKSVKDAVILVKRTEPTPEIVMDIVDFNRPRVHVDIPYLEG